MPKETNKKQSKDKKHFMKDFKAELKRVVWPTPKQLFNNTVAVITVVLLTAAIVFVLDFAFENINKYGIDKLKAVVGTTNEVVVNNEEENSTEANETNVNEEVNINETADTNNVE